jgi:rare lipoprotein A
MSKERRLALKVLLTGLAGVLLGLLCVSYAHAGDPVKASWYGPRFAGRKTASGERFDPKRLTAASKTLPINSVVKVTNPHNGKSVNVRINDRCLRGRSLDLSEGAARKLGIVRRGIARVRVEVTRWRKR